MSQGLLTVSDGSGLSVLAAVNALAQRLATMASGTSRPSDIAAGELWRETDNPGTGVHSIWLYDGASDVLVALLDTTAHAIALVSTTQSAGNNTTRVATTAFVLAEIAATIASQAEQETGTSTAKLVSPGRQHFHPSAAKAWINFNGTGTVAIGTSYNVSSLDDDGTGSYGVNFTNAFSSVNYAVVATAGENTPSSVPIVMTRTAPAVGSVDLYVAGIGGPPFDSNRVSVACFGDL